MRPDIDAEVVSPTRRRIFAGVAALAAVAVAEKPSRAAGTPPVARRWLGKAGFGATAADVNEFNALGSNDDARWNAWLTKQLAPASINDSACEARLAAANFTTLRKTQSELWTQHRATTGFTRALPLYETECATLIRAIYSKRQLFERMVGFWHDHFSVYGADYDLQALFPAWDRDVIRAHALGNFRALLGATARAPVMLYYLDNYTSGSTAAGFNENYARELIELHTLGVENYYGPKGVYDVPCIQSQDFRCEGSFPAGYVDNDVYDAAAAFTGWTVKNGHWSFPNENDGSFTYRAAWHDRRNKIVLGKYIRPNQPALKDGDDVLDILCAHPGTARHIARKLCVRFVGENPSQSLIGAVARAFAEHASAPDQIARMLRVILVSDEFRTSWGDGIKRPFESTVAALRALDVDWTPLPDNTSEWTTTEDFFSGLLATGHRPFRWGPPNGYPDTQRAWASTGALAMTLRLLSSLPEMRLKRGDDSSRFLADVTAQTIAAIPTAANRSANAIVNHWCQKIFGYIPQPAAQVAIDFLRQDAAADAALVLDETWRGSERLSQHYTQSRLRTTVSMLLASPDLLRR